MSRLVYWDNLVQYGRGVGANVVGQSYSVYHLGPTTSGGIETGAPLFGPGGTISTNYLQASITKAKRAHVVENTTFELLTFEAIVDNRKLSLGDVLVETGYEGTGSNYVVAQRRPMRPTVLVRSEQNISISRPTPLGGAAQIDGADNAAAAAQCDVAVLTVPFSGQAALLKQLKSVWKLGTVMIDTTVPLAAAVGGSPTRMLGVWQGSAAEAAAELLPEGVSIAGAFQNLGAELLAGDAPIDCDVLVCSDDEKAKQVAMELAAKIPGVRALNGGKLENARIVESITALLIGLNIRYKVHSAGLRFTGLPAK